MGDGYCDEHQVLYIGDESLNSTPETKLHCMLTTWNLHYTQAEQEFLFY